MIVTVIVIIKRKKIRERDHESYDIRDRDRVREQKCQSRSWLDVANVQNRVCFEPVVIQNC